MIIDFSTHLVPASIAKLGIKFQQISGLWDIEERLRLMKKYKVDKQVVTITASIFKGATGKKEVDLCKMANNELAKIQDKYDGRFVALASVPMTAPDDAIDEIQRAHNDLGMPGVELYSNAKGKSLDSAEFFKLYEQLVKLDMPIFLHPTDWNWESYGLLNEFRLKNRIGWPFDTAQAMTRIVYGGILDKFPKLKIVTHHLGSIVPVLMGRLNSFYVQLEDREDVRPTTVLEKKFKMFYGDTAVNCWLLALKTGYEFFGAKHMVFGSDYPYGNKGGEGWLRGNIEIMKALRIPSSEKELIWGENAAKLLKL